MSESNVFDIKTGKRLDPVVLSPEIKEQIRDGFIKYQSKYVGRAIDNTMICELCCDIVIDALTEIRKSEKN
jgi:hypothetical protein